MIDRAKLRGKPLDKDCYGAIRSRHEYGLQDDRIFCYGLMDLMTEELLDKCKECKAHVDNAGPIKIECLKCKNCTGYSCILYGKDAVTAVQNCADDGFKNYSIKVGGVND